MIKAIRSFELERETTFSTYAVPLIIGEIRRHLRDDGLIKISRIQRKLGMELMKLRNQMLSNDGKEPSIDVLAELCQVSVEEAAFALDAISPVSSLSDGVGDGENLTLESRIADDENDIKHLSDSIALGQAIDKLSPMWKKIVILRYFKNFTQQQTAVFLGLSQVKVSREEKKIIEFLRQELVV
jgi:RNA polymerase sporulation-specific sigma factor